MIKLNNFRVEFGYEMISLYPYAYWLKEFQREKIHITTNKGMKPFYYFADIVEYHEQNRNWFYEGDTVGVDLLSKSGVPNAWIHKPQLDLFKFLAPELNKVYANKEFHKNAIFISNRYNNEWTGVEGLGKPINYFDLEILERIFTKYKKRHIYFFSTYGIKDFEDGVDQLYLGDYDLCKCFQNVEHIADICDITDSEAFNTTQLKILANCSDAITMNGGGCILASYFPLRNLIYYRPVFHDGRWFPKEHQTGDYGYYHNFNKWNDICIVNSYNELLKNIRL